MLQARLAAETEDTESAEPGSDTPDQQSSTLDISREEMAGMDPFLHNYHTEYFEFDADSTDQALGLVIAVTNLL